MQIGKFHIEQLSEGRFQIFEDGTIHRLEPEKRSNVTSELSQLENSRSRRIGIGPVLVSTDTDCILLDTGLGWGLDRGSAYAGVSNVKTNLAIFSRTPEEVTHVVLSHLHYDHAAGSTFTAGSGKTLPTFPNARYMVQRKEWEAALERYDKPDPVPGAGYHIDDLLILAGEDRFEFLDSPVTEIADGVEAIRTGGHTPGHQAVRITDGEQRLYYLGDLLPDDTRLNECEDPQINTDPLEAKKRKLQLLKRIYSEQAVLLFYHSLHARSGTLDKDGTRQYILSE